MKNKKQSDQKHEKVRYIKLQKKIIFISYIQKQNCRFERKYSIEINRWPRINPRKSKIYDADVCTGSKI